MARIQVLPPEVVKKIAAGEVVERPASIVKELLENSLDAGATQIKVSIAAGGMDLICLEDNGAGIEEQDLGLALKLHATSKLTQIEDLDSIDSYGFRGEALASIAAVSDVSIITAIKGKMAFSISEESPTPTPASRSQGTTVVVKNLFRQVPARRKFLKSPASEEKAIRTLVKNFALVNPGIALIYANEGKEVFNLQPSQLKDRIVQLYKIKTEDLIELKPEPKVSRPSENPSELHLELTGYIGHPRVASKLPPQFLSVNGRIIKNQTITAAIKTAYGNKIPPELKPSFFTKIVIPTDYVDVNVHPRKEEIKFSDDKKLFSRVFHRVEELLATHMRAEFESRFAATNINASKPSVILEKDFPVTLFASDSKISPAKITNHRDTSPASKIDRDYSRKPANPYTPSTLPPLTEEVKFLQIFQTYLLIEKGNSLLVIDQHAADERIKYEAIKSELAAGEIQNTPLLIPSYIDIDNTGSSDIEELVLELNKFGFETETFGEAVNGKTSLKISAVPLLLFNSQQLDNIEKIARDLSDAELDTKVVEQKLDRAIATIACHSSIRAGQDLRPSQVQKLISDLWKCKDPYTCPHGRPIVWEVSRTQLEKNFYRVK